MSSEAKFLKSSAPPYWLGMLVGWLGMLVRWGEAWGLDPRKIHPRDLTTCAFPPTHMVMMMMMIMVVMMIIMVIIITKANDYLTTHPNTNIGVAKNYFQISYFWFNINVQISIKISFEQLSLPAYCALISTSCGFQVLCWDECCSCIQYKSRKWQI